MSPLPDLPALLDCAVAAATAAGNHALRNAARRQEAIAVTAHDVKLKLDVECQAVAEQIVRAAYPTHAILGEESTDPAAASAPAGLEWIIDPIDGTVNFSHGLPFWCCSVAVRQAGRTVAGAIYAPVLKELFTATSDSPALCNGAPIRVSMIKRLKAAMVLTGLDKNPDPKVPPFEVFHRLGELTQKTRILGSAALDLCRVALGQADGYYESGIFVWDIAAGELIVRQAGGRVETLREQPGHRLSFIASNGMIHDELRAAVQ